MSKELKRRGFRFIGPTTCYAFMQSAGLVDDHTIGLLQPYGRPVALRSRLRSRVSRSREQEAGMKSRTLLAVLVGGAVLDRGSDRSLDLGVPGRRRRRRHGYR